MTFTPYATLPFYPGPVSLHPAASEVLRADYGPPRFGDEYAEMYRNTCHNLQKMCGTTQEVVIPTGEGMLGLWSALKCTLKPGDAVVTVGTGVFGDGFADMALALGCVVEKVSLPYNSTISVDALEKVDDAIRRLKPVMLTAVHCETPSGTLNPLDGLGALKKERGVPLFVVDAVSSIGGAPVYGDAWNVDLLLGGSQKCLGCPADMSFLAISDAAWERIAGINYQGYEALLPFHHADQNPMNFPYTPNWFGVAAMHASSSAMLAEGLMHVFTRHKDVAQLCRNGLAELHIPLWTAPDAVNSPTVTAALVPSGFSWPEWKATLARHGLIVGGSLGPMAGKVFRLGHMGPQADATRMAAAINVMEEAMKGSQ